MSIQEEMQTFVTEMFKTILGDEDTAVEYSEDPEGYLASHGATEHDLSEVDYEKAFSDACEEIPGGDSYASTPPYSGGGGIEGATNHYVTNVYEGNTTIVQNINNNETNIHIEGDGNIVEVGNQQAIAEDGDVAQLDVDIDAEAPKYEEVPPKYEEGVDLDIDANLNETNIGINGDYNEVDVDNQQAIADGDDYGSGYSDDSLNADVNANATNIGINGSGNNVDVDNQQAIADDGDVVQVNAEVDAGYGSGSAEFQGQAVGGGDESYDGSHDTGYDDGSAELDVNANATNIEVEGNYNDVSVDNQQAIADDGGEVAQADLDVDLG